MKASRPAALALLALVTFTAAPREADAHMVHFRHFHTHHYRWHTWHRYHFWHRYYYRNYATTSGSACPAGYHLGYLGRRCWPNRG